MDLNLDPTDPLSAQLMQVGSGSPAIAGGPIPTQTSFNAMVNGQPSPQQAAPLANATAPQAPAPSPAPAQSAMPTAPDPAPAPATSAIADASQGGPAELMKGNPLGDMFSDPRSLLIMGATLMGDKRPGESLAGHLSRALMAGNAFAMAKQQSQQNFDQTQTQNAQDQQRLDSTGALQGAQAAGLQGQEQRAQDLQGLTKDELTAKINVAKQQVASAKTDAERTAAQTNLTNLETQIKRQTGVADVQSQIGLRTSQAGAADAAGGLAQAESTAKASTTAHQDQVNSTFANMTEDQRAATLNPALAAQMKMTPQQRLQAFMEKDGPKFLDPKTGNMDMNAALGAYQQQEAFLKNPQAPLDKSPAAVRQRALAAVSAGKDKKAVNAKLIEMGYPPLQ